MMVTGGPGIKEKLVDFLVKEYDCERRLATPAVEMAIGEGLQPDDTEAAAEYIYSTQRFWEE